MNENQEKKRNKDDEEFGTEARAVVDSRIYEHPSFFLCVLFITLGAQRVTNTLTFRSGMK